MRYFLLGAVGGALFFLLALLDNALAGEALAVLVRGALR
jgi:hypothetical protein